MSGGIRVNRICRNDHRFGCVCFILRGLEPPQLVGNQQHRSDGGSSDQKGQDRLCHQACGGVESLQDPSQNCLICNNEPCRRNVSEEPVAPV
jgi:hypothetical protein